MKKTIGICILVLTFAVSTSCSVEPIVAEEIVSDVIISWADIETYQFDMDMEMNMSGYENEDQMQIAMRVTSNGAVDLRNKEMGINISTSMDMPDSGNLELDNMEFDMGMYLVDNTVYISMDIPEIGPMWMKSQMANQYWEQGDQLEPQIQLLAAGYTELVGVEMIKGVECYVLVLTPNTEELWNMIAQQTEFAYESALSSELDVLQDMLQGVTVKQWIAKDTYYLMRSRIEMAINVTPEDIGFFKEDGSISMDITMDLMVYDYNQPVDIILPDEADQAIEFPIFEFTG
jgi:hypothetical protein